MRRLSTLFAFSLFFAGQGFAQTVGSETPDAPETTIRTYFEPEGEVFVGQTVRLWLEILTTGGFKNAPMYPELKVEGAIALLPEQFGVNYSDTEGGKQRTGQRQRYAIVPVHDGQLQIPALTVPLTVTAVDGSTETVDLVSEPLTLNALKQPGAEGADYIVSVVDLKISETYKQNGDSLKVGDAIERRIETSAEGTFALALPPVVFAPVEGANVYPKEPVLSDNINRGTYLAKRTDSATYVFEQEGSFTLPEVTVVWFDLESGSVQTEVFPEKSVTVAVNPAFKDTGTDQAGILPVAQVKLSKMRQVILSVLEWVRDNRWPIAGLLLALAAATYTWRRMHVQISEYLETRRQARLRSEKHAFHLFAKACHRSDPSEMRRLFWLWVGRAVPGKEVATFRDLKRQVPQARFIPFARDIAGASCGRNDTNGTSVSGQDVLRQARKFRSELLQSLEPSGRTGQGFLNPRSPVFESH